MRDRVPVVILKAARHGGLAVARTLGRMGVPVYTVDRGRWSAASASRYTRRTFTWDIENEPGERSLEFLLSLTGCIGEGAVLLPTSDAGARFVAEYAGDLAAAYRFPRAPEGLVERLCNKKEMHFVASAAGIPVPHAFFPHSVDDVRRFARHSRFPVMLKGIDGPRLERKAGRRMFLVSRADELVRLYSRHEDPHSPNLMAQQYIPGADGTVWMFNGYFDRDSCCLAGATGSKIRQYPAATGLTTLGECIANREVLDLSCRLAQTLGYHGLLDIDYRYDARDGRYKILDVNPRVGATFRLFAHRDGFDVVRAAYADLTGEGVEPRPLPDGRRWLVEDLDIVSAMQALASGRLSVGAWLASLRRIDETAIFSGDDPVPALAFVTADVAEAVRRVARACHGRTAATRDGRLLTRAAQNRYRSRDRERAVGAQCPHV